MKTSLDQADSTLTKPVRKRWENGRFRDEAHKQQVLAQNRESYKRHAESYHKRTGDRNAGLKLAALEAHGALACQRCGYDKSPAALEFHHRNPATKLFNIAMAVTAPKKYPWETILAELAKCDVICSNCHKEEHCDRDYSAWEVKRAARQGQAFLGSDRLNVD